MTTSETPSIPVSIPDLMVIRGIIMKMSLDTASWRTADEFERLSEFMEWLYAFQDAWEDGFPELRVRLVGNPSPPSR